MKALVSIIIPTYNRAHLIGETLDSIIAQTHTNWECIVIDDDSYDYTVELMEFYNEKDPRIQFYHRPENRKKGANACRNYGFEISKGDYINWFDSDDLMIVNFIETKLKAFESRDYDFILSKTINFLPDGETYKPFYGNKNLNLENYLFREINWLTPDALLLSCVIKKNDLKFNESMSSDQEYNFYARLLTYTENGLQINKELTKRRIHNRSTQGLRKIGDNKYVHEKFLNRYLTFKDLEKRLNTNIRDKFLSQIMTIYYFNPYHILFPKIFWNFLNSIYKNKGVKKLLYFLLSLATNFFTGKGYSLLQRSKA